ncbi:MAG TPA: DUF5695 domain-containing protein, partial [Candidatus Acidoferrales bacterium]|nr:DUF5695 domain-containing protein [Candidatus Acidoferrales bacterium]
GDRDAFLKGYAGVMSVMHNVLPDGMGFNFFICTPGVFDHEPPRTFESGEGLWGFLKSAKSYIMKDDTFGLVGCGCEVEQSAGKITVTPKDGLKKRIRFVEERIDLEATQGEISQLAFSKSPCVLELKMGDSTGNVKTAAVTVRGLQKGEYRIRYGKTLKKVSSDGTLTVTAPLAAARNLRIEKV